MAILLIADSFWLAVEAWLSLFDRSTLYLSRAFCVHFDARARSSSLASILSFLSCLKSTFLVYLLIRFSFNSFGVLCSCNSPVLSRELAGAGCDCGLGLAVLSSFSGRP